MQLDSTHVQLPVVGGLPGATQYGMLQAVMPLYCLQLYGPSKASHSACCMRQDMPALQFSISACYAAMLNCAAVLQPALHAVPAACLLRRSRRGAVRRCPAAHLHAFSQAAAARVATLLSALPGW